MCPTLVSHLKGRRLMYTNLNLLIRVQLTLMCPSTTASTPKLLNHLQRRRKESLLCLISRTNTLNLLRFPVQWQGQQLRRQKSNSQTDLEGNRTLKVSFRSIVKPSMKSYVRILTLVSCLARLRKLMKTSCRSSQAYLTHRRIKSHTSNCSRSYQIQRVYLGRRPKGVKTLNHRLKSWSERQESRAQLLEIRTSIQKSQT